MGTAWKAKFKPLVLSSEEMVWIAENFDPHLSGEGRAMYGLITENLPDDTPEVIKTLVEENGGVLYIEIVW